VAGGIGTANWNVNHVVTVTGVDDSVLDFTIPYAIQTGGLTGDNAYLSVATPDVAGVNIDNEVVPKLDEVWGGGGGGGCGLLGLEAVVLLALLRRRKR